MGTVIGIDLGTTFSAMASIDETGRPRIAHNSEGQNITPSCVMVEPDGRVVVGSDAEKIWGINPDDAAARFKRDMGTSKTFPVNGRDFTPTQLSSLVLKKLKQDAEKTLGQVDEAVVTIPANFSHEARDATMTAAREAGLKVQYIINEPTAAALYYAFRSGEELSGNYAVYDMGGGTFDISVIRVDGQNVEVLASNGVARLGGDDFDQAIVDIVRQKYNEATGDGLEPEDYSKEDAEADKKSLSNRDQVRVRAARQSLTITRAEFEAKISHLISSAEMNCEDTVEEAGLVMSDLTGVLLAGGSTRVPAVRANIEKTFGQAPIDSVNVDEIVALGAALYAAYRSDKKNLSAIQQKAVEKIKVSESTGMCFGTISLGIVESRQEIEEQNSVLIRKGDRIPCSVTRSFYTVSEGQQSVRCTVTESSAPESDPRFVKTVWEGDLELPPGRPAEQEIQVTFAYDANQIMKVSFMDVASGKKTTQDLSYAESGDATVGDIDKFLVE